MYIILLIYIYISSSKLDSHIPEKLFYVFQWKSSKNDEKSFWFHFKTFFVLEIFKWLPWIFAYVKKMTWLERYGVKQKVRMRRN